MSQQIQRVTQAALREWQESNTRLSFAEYVVLRKVQGAYWGSAENLDGAPQ